MKDFDKMFFFFNVFLVEAFSLMTDLFVYFCILDGFVERFVFNVKRFKVELFDFFLKVKANVKIELLKLVFEIVLKIFLHKFESNY